mmetsp:Transcript_14282/g.42111  ORF Transcript_14282/g.42111 Transcript_14282/m.42111 type:complete len:84 (+) Transcript_14282:946-1197(+)
MAINQPRFALDAFDKSMAIDDSIAAAFHARGHACQALGQLEEAMASFNSAVRLDPLNEDLRRDREQLAQRLGKQRPGPRVWSE